MNSALYCGWVRHRRFTPRRHDFRYRMGLLYLDLAEQDQVLGLSRLAGNGRWAAFSFRETDYLPQLTREGVSLSEAVRQYVGEALGDAPRGRICLLTQPRSWGLAFNPVSFFYCHGGAGQLEAILCEVSNTPWRERYHYVLPVNGIGHQHVAVAKAFHVSPFMPPDLEYRMSLGPAGERLGIHMTSWQDGTRVFDASLSLHRRALDRGSLHRYLLAFPWMTGKTLAAIHWQALRLLLKRIPLFNHQAAQGTFRVAHSDPDHEKL